MNHEHVNKKNKYIKEFFSLNCHKDILDIIGNINNLDKEITEAMSIIHLTKRVALNKDIKTLIDFCSGNALLPIISSFLFKFELNIATDKNDYHINKEYHRIENFMYLLQDINEIFIRINPVSLVDSFDNNQSIITAIHPCKNLARQVINVYNHTNAKYLCIMPCCIGDFKNKIKMPRFMLKRFSKYELWCLDLANEIENSKIKIIHDKNVISPRNIIITAKKLGD
jgi:hypothetical protein